VKPYQEHGPQRHNRPQHHGLGLLDSRLGISHHRRLDGGGARGAARGGRLGAQREGVGLGDGEHLGGFGGSGVGCAKDGRALRRSSGEVFVGAKTWGSGTDKEASWRFINSRNPSVVANPKL
jgi:hypothetical protein